MENYIIISVVSLIIIFGVIRMKKHFTGGGGCCSSGGGTIRDKKTLTEPVIGEKIMHIEGMTCVNCEIRVENALNRQDGVLCKVNLKKKDALISFTKEQDNDKLKEIVERLGYTVTGIE